MTRPKACGSAPILAAVVVLAAASAVLSPPAHAQESTPAGLTPTEEAGKSEIERIARDLLVLENSRCLACHVGDSAHAQSGGLLFGVPASANGVVRQSPGFMTSNHGEMACTTCHVGAFRGYPHEAAPAAMPAATLECAECHASRTHTIEAEITRSVHAENFGDSFSCTTCHDPHVMVSGAGVADPLTLVAQDNGACLSCHGSDERFAEFTGDATPEVPRPDIDAIHAWLPNPERHWAAVRCVDCHTPMVKEGALLGVSHRIVDKDEARRDCATCHTVDSALRTTLYRHLNTSEASARGFENAVIAQSSYVIGATRNTTLDLIGVLATLAVLAGVLGHGFLRWRAARTRERHAHE